MITKDEIITVADETGLTPAIVEKEYVLGWLLAAVNMNVALSSTWVFKGGTCLKKCYFETYRFSEDWILRCAMRPTSTNCSSKISSLPLLNGCTKLQALRSLKIVWSSMSMTTLEAENPVRGEFTIKVILPAENVIFRRSILI